MAIESVTINVDRAVEGYPSLKKSQYFFYYAFLKWIRHLFDTDVLHLRVHEKKLDRPLVIIANHTSAWDPFLIFSILKREFFFSHLLWRLPAAADQFESWHQRIFFKFIGVYPIERKGDLLRSLETTFRILDSGHSTIFFPEAKKVMHNEKAEPKKGIGYLLENRSVYILPVFLEYKRRNKNKKGVRIGKARAVIGDVIKSEYFVEKYQSDIRHKAVMSYVYGLEKHLIKRFGEDKK
jgi:1-acyl-sn-glycerol-3-phosphate acyltransferase